MNISGIVPFSLIEYPNTISCVIFTPGCNFRCGYCHNSEFVLPEKLRILQKTFIPQEAFFNFLEKRKGKLQGVSICGGEPCMQKDILDFCVKIKEKGFLVKLDTNGSFPDVLEKLLEKKVLDYIAMDIKQEDAFLEKVIGGKTSLENMRKSREIIQNSGIDYEFRTTLISGVHSLENMREIAKTIPHAKAYYLQNFRPGETLDPNFCGKSFSFEMLKTFQNAIAEYTPNVQIRS